MDTIDTLAEATEYLMSDGNLSVPCSRYGRTTSDCVPVAWALALVCAESTGDPITWRDLDAIMGLVVNDHDDVDALLTDRAQTVGWNYSEGEAWPMDPTRTDGQYPTA